MAVTAASIQRVVRFSRSTDVAGGLGEPQVLRQPGQGRRQLEGAGKDIRYEHWTERGRVSGKNMLRYFSV